MRKIENTQINVNINSSSPLPIQSLITFSKTEILQLNFKETQDLNFFMFYINFLNKLVQMLFLKRRQIFRYLLLQFKSIFFPLIPIFSLYNHLVVFQCLKKTSGSFFHLYFPWEFYNSMSLNAFIYFILLKICIV